LQPIVTNTRGMNALVKLPPRIAITVAAFEAICAALQ
jgi:hypothetical protein